MEVERYSETTTVTTTTTKTKTITKPIDSQGSVGSIAANATSPIIEEIPTGSRIKASLSGIPAHKYFLQADNVVTIQSREKIPAAVQVWRKMVPFISMVLILSCTVDIG